MRYAWWMVSVVLAAFTTVQGSAAAKAEALNLLILTVDDMSADSVGAFGCPLPGTTPHIDRLAADGMKFERAHVTAPNCMPSRNVMWSGLYPHANGVEGFQQVPGAKHPHLADLMQQAGYFTAIQHKVAHSTPYAPYPAWDLDLSVGPDGKRRDVKAPNSYGAGTAQGIAAAKEAGKPFCLVINIADPHKPFYAEQPRTGETVSDRNVPSRVFKPKEVPVPGFLFDDPVVRKELAHYYSTVRRADDAVGAVLAALEASGQREKTAVVFLSDHGMPLPFAKTQLYHHGTWTPLIFVVPGVTKPGAADDRHMVSAVDLLPTLLDVVGAPNSGKTQGRSFAPLLAGEKQDGRDAVFKVHNLNAGGVRNTMRAVQTQKYLYLFNPWSDGRRTMATATRGTPTYRRMARLAKADPALAARHDLFLYRVPEELYDVANDPDCLENLIDAPVCQEALAELRDRLEAWMDETGDPAVAKFREQVQQP